MFTSISGRGRQVVVGVSLKMYFDVAQSRAWAEQAVAIASRHRAVTSGRARVFVLPTLAAMPGVRDALAGSPVELGAQDLFWADRGAYTGGVSGADLVACGCRLVELGHAERRRFFGDDDETVDLKLAAAVRHGLSPVLCVGEPTRGSADDAAELCAQRLRGALKSAGRPADDVPLVVAYEPEWAIGAEDAADPDHVLVVADRLRSVLDEADWPGEASIIYGGSAKPGLLSRLGSAVDGLFLGRSVHDPDSLGAVLDETIARR